MRRVVVPEAHHRGAAAGGDHRTVVDRLVRATVEKNRPGACEHRQHRHVDVRDRGHRQHVLAAQQFLELLLDVEAGARAAEQPRPGRVRAPARKVLGHGGDDFRVEVESEVVARGPVGEPVVTNSDLTSTLLFDHGVHHGVRCLQLHQVVHRMHPAIEPATARALGVQRRNRLDGGGGTAD